MKQRILLTKYIDHTNLSPTAKNADIRKLCVEALKFDFKSVCIHPCKIKICLEELADSDILICTVVGFPLGQNTIASKVAETIDAVSEGADEIDMVANIAEIKTRNKRYLLEEINSVVKASNGRLVKVIVETALLTKEEKIFAFEVVNESMAHYIKTSTGFSTSGAKLEDIELWNELKCDSGSDLKIKAAGGISSYDDMLNFIEAGAERIGTSRSVQLFEGNDKMATANMITYLSIKENPNIKNKIIKKTNVDKKEDIESANKKEVINSEENKTNKSIEKKSKKSKKNKNANVPSEY